MKKIEVNEFKPIECERCGSTGILVTEGFLSLEPEPCPDCNAPMGRLHGGAFYDIQFAVDAKGNGWLVNASSAVIDFINENGMGMSLDDNGFEDSPEEPGFYWGKAQFHSYPGYQSANGDSEPDWCFTVSDVKKFTPTLLQLIADRPSSWEVVEDK